MKQTEKHISDELLTRWMCGQATPEEEAEVLDYLSESDEHIDDLKTIVAATQVGNDMQRPRIIVYSSSKKSIIRISLAIAASVALVICLTIPLWRTASRTFGGGGTSPCPPGSGTMCTSPWGATAGAWGGSS